MNENDFLEKLKFPIGTFQKPLFFETNLADDYLETLSSFANEVQKTIANCTLEQLCFRYRPDGWTVKQVIHHCADSHMNAFVRIKLALTENHPTICPYDETLWAALCDGESDHVESSLHIIAGVHHRLVLLLGSLSENDFGKTYFHPGSQTNFTIFEATALYAWHCKHHLKHLEQGIFAKGKYN